MSKNFSGVYKKLWEKIIKNKYVVAVVVLGIILIAFPFGKSKDGDVEQTGQTNVVDNVFSLEEQEEKVAAALSKIDGAGEVQVVLTLNTSTEQVVAQNEETAVKSDEESSESSSGIETVIVSDGGSGEGPVTLKYIYPEYRGALVVAGGAGNPSVKLQITEAVSALTGLGTDKITVTKMKES